MGQLVKDYLALTFLLPRLNFTHVVGGVNEALALLTPQDRERLLNACITGEPAAGEELISAVDADLVANYKATARQPVDGDVYFDSRSSRYVFYYEGEVYDNLGHSRTFTLHEGWLKLQEPDVKAMVLESFVADCKQNVEQLQQELAEATNYMTLVKSYLEQPDGE